MTILSRNEKRCSHSFAAVSEHFSENQKSQEFPLRLCPCSCGGIYSGATLVKSELSQALHGSLSILALQGKPVCG